MYGAKHRELVQKARAAGLTQCTGARWRDTKGEPLLEFGGMDIDAIGLASCDETGLLRWGVYKHYLTVEEAFLLRQKLIDAVDCSLIELNDEGMTWEQFTELLEGV